MDCSLYTSFWSFLNKPQLCATLLDSVKLISLVAIIGITIFFAVVIYQVYKK